MTTLHSTTPLLSGVVPATLWRGCPVTGQSFGARLKQLREQAGLTQPQLAERAGMNRFGIAKLEQGDREPSWATVRALARALGVRCAAFEDDEERPPTEGPPQDAGQDEGKAKDKGRKRKGKEG